MATQSGVSDRVEADNVGERVCLVGRSQTWANKARSSIDRSGIHAGRCSSELHEMSQDLGDFRPLNSVGPFSFS